MRQAHIPRAMTPPGLSVKLIALLGLIAGASITHATTRRAAPAAASGAEEFAGPLAGWMDAKREFGAAGDGKADDTAALQKALDALRPSDSPRRVLYIPAGTYRIARTLRVTRATHAESMDIMI